MNYFKSFLLSAIVVLNAVAFVSCSKDKDDDNNNKSKTLIIDVDGITIKMIKVDGGEFSMGLTEEQLNGLTATQMAEAVDEKPVHKVKVKTFYIAETEVTQELWKAVTGTNPSSNKKDYHPVETVSWEDCVLFIYKLNMLTGKHFRLPTEAEWEFAARGGKKSKHYQYSGDDDVDMVAWHYGNASESQEVQTRACNELGIIDMSGNVYEWCNDIYWKDYYNYSPADNPQGPNESEVPDKNRRVVRGGSITSSSDRARVAFRWSYDKTHKSYNTGLRLAMDE